MDLIRQICMNRIAKDVVGNFMRNLAVDIVMIYWYSQEHNVAAADNSFTFTQEQPHHVVHHDGR